jgi:NAD(P)-dependent dehydrogenase (short-subunit alcohol dehydrogenase family)
VLLVTGGSRGIGAATALLAAKRGYAVAVNYTSNSLAADEVVRAIRAGGGTAIAVQADVGDEDQVLACSRRSTPSSAGSPALVNNAGVVDVAARVDEMSHRPAGAHVRINVIGSLVCAREAVRRMSTKHGGAGGAIVNLSSGAAAGRAGPVRRLRRSQGRHRHLHDRPGQGSGAEGIRVNAVRPGLIDTEIHASGGMPDRAATRAPGAHAARRHRRRSRRRHRLAAVAEASYTTMACSTCREGGSP